jgi:GNAT superfamily N-acetyltransferase
MLQIESLQPTDWHAAFEVALAPLPPGERAQRIQQCIHFLETGVLDPNGIWVARDGGRILAAQICVPLAGSACLFWLPGADDDCAAAVVQAGLDWCRSRGCKLAQALAQPEEMARTPPLLRCGFRATTRLQQWRRNFIDLPRYPPPTLRFERYRPALDADLAATLERSYDGTLDCPELDGVRTMDEIIAGHRGQGKFHPDFWWLAYDGAMPIGVALFVEMPDATTWELAYLGIVPEQRRRGLARALLIHALHALSAQPATAVALSVDARNGPAQRLYQSLGFVETETSEVFLYFF